MVTCSAYGCTNRTGKSNRSVGVSFHRFPNDPQKRSKWIAAVCRKDWAPTTHSTLCSLHFKNDDFISGLHAKRLKKEAIPSIFTALPVYLQKTNPISRTRSTSLLNDDSRKLLKKDSSKGRSDKRQRSNDSSENTGNESQTNKSELVIKHLLLKINTLEKKLKKVTRDLRKYTNEVRTLRQWKRRNSKKIFNLEDIINQLDKNNNMCKDNLDLLKNMSNVNKELITRQLNIINNEKLSKFSPEFKAFAVTLHFFSPKAYRYVRTTFNSCLPHERTIKKWYSSVEGKPGFTSEALSALKFISNMGNENNNKYFWSLIIDEMAIRKHVEFDGNSFHGYVDFGTNANDDNFPVAKGALVFMLVCVNSNWKIPIGYFFISTINSDQLACLILQALENCHSVGATVVNVTFDGLSTNLSMASKLGCKISSENIISTFKHPVTKNDVSIMMDPCHMIKLIRNTLGDKREFLDQDGNLISWKHIENLHELQEKEGLHLGNKIRKSHIQWKTQKMKVKLAVQVFSESVGDALIFCSESKIQGFENVTGTIKFIKIINRLFDVLNSRSLNQKGWKKPLTQSNISEVEKFFEESENYIKKLTDRKGNKLIESSRKTGFLGFIVCMKSAIHLFKELVSQNILFYIPTYKLNQDHLELFFSSIRSLNGCNNNPTSRQFTSAYKRLAIHSQLKEESSGNCLNLESIKIFNRSLINSSTPFTIINESAYRTKLVENNPDVNLNLSQYDLYFSENILLGHPVEEIVKYIAGFVVKKMKNKLSCEICIAALFSPAINNNQRYLPRNLISVKNKGGLIYPSDDVIKICIDCEKIMKHNSNLKGKFSNKPIQMLTSLVMAEYVGEHIFRNLADHMYDQEPGDNHIIHLSKSICHTYFSLRLKHWAKLCSDNLHEKKIRNINNKMILFQGQ